MWRYASAPPSSHPVGLFAGAFGLGTTSLFLAPARRPKLIQVAPPIDTLRFCDALVVVRPRPDLGGDRALQDAEIITLCSLRGTDLRVVSTEPQQGASYDDCRVSPKPPMRGGFDGFFRSDHHLTIDGDGLRGPTDAWVTLGASARETSRVRLGTLLSPVTFRLPGPHAIQVAQVDAISGGRVKLGIGVGWFEAEYVAYGIPFPEPRERFDRLIEQVAIMDGLWRTPLRLEFKPVS